MHFYYLEFICFYGGILLHALEHAVNSRWFVLTGALAANLKTEMTFLALFTTTIHKIIHKYPN